MSLESDHTDGWGFPIFPPRKQPWKFRKMRFLKKKQWKWNRRGDACLQKRGLGGGFIQIVFAIFTFPSLELHDSEIDWCMLFTRVETTN